MKTKFTCPLCGKPLSEREYLSVTGRWEHLHELETKFKQQLKTSVDKARRDERTRVSNQVLVKNRQIVHLKGQIARLQAQSEKGLTPQLAGLLYEKELQRALADKFRQDEIIHTGKGGDVLQHVRLNGRRVGTIVYECKDVSKLQRSHVDQARRAKVQRAAEYAVVVTPAKIANSFGFWVERDVLLIHPAGVLVLAAWLRDALVELAKARLPRTAREKAAREILAFISGSDFRNAVQDAIRRAEELGEQLIDEVRAHRGFWEKRLDHYRAIWIDARRLAQSATGIVEAHSLPGKRRALVPVEVKTYPIDKSRLLPSGAR